MSGNDVTKPNNHLFWLWLAFAALVSLCATGYLELRGRTDQLAEKISASDLKLQVQLAKIETQLCQIDKSLLELKELKKHEEK